MKRYSIAVLVLWMMSSVLAGPLYAQPVERKIIIDKGQFYFFTIDEENQLATLHTGAVKEKLSKAKKYPVPLGRELSDPFNPLCFDINDGVLIGINWILNSNNSRYDAIKRIDLQDWKKKRPEWTAEDWAQVSFDQPVLGPNEPWREMLERNNVLQNCFFDLVQIESKIMAICNQGQLRIWAFGGGKWTPLSKSVPVDFTAYFSLISIRNATVGIIDAKGSIYRLDESAATITKVKAGNETKPQVLIVDNDHYKTYSIASEAIEAAGFLSVEDLVKQSKEIIF